jgi:hypothetical protein
MKLYEGRTWRAVRFYRQTICFCIIVKITKVVTDDCGSFLDFRKAFGVTPSKRPKGSLLGPVFLIYVYDLPDVVDPGSQVASFADDTKMYCLIDSVFDAKVSSQPTRVV